MRSFMWWQCCVILRRGKGKDTSSEQTVFVPGPSVCVGGAMLLIHRLDHIRMYSKTGTLIITKQIDDYQKRKN